MNSTAGDGAFSAPPAPPRDLHARIDTDEAITKAMTQWDKENTPRVTIADVADHIDHIRQVAGMEHIGIGADFYRPNPT